MSNLMAQPAPVASPALAPVEMSPTGYVQTTAPVFSQQQNFQPSQPGALLHRQKASSRLKTCIQISACCNCNLTLFCKAEEVQKRTFIDVYNNKIEWNTPSVPPLPSLRVSHVSFNLSLF